jgi:hypothetical protein
MTNKLGKKFEAKKADSIEARVVGIEKSVVSHDKDLRKYRIVIGGIKCECH